ncbi:Uncharacterized protein DAT39_021031, partial [Clarias magur]
MESFSPPLSSPYTELGEPAMNAAQLLSARLLRTNSSTTAPERGAAGFIFSPSARADHFSVCVSPTAARIFPRHR